MRPVVLKVAKQVTTQSVPSCCWERPLGDTKTQLVSVACNFEFLCFLAAGAPTSSADRSAALASSVFEGVRSKMKQLQATVDVRDHRIAALEADMQAAAQEHREALREAQQRQKAGAGGVAVSVSWAEVSRMRCCAGRSPGTQ